MVSIVRVEMENKQETTMNMAASKIPLKLSMNLSTVLAILVQNEELIWR
jgi:hypothetical protein